MALASRGVHYAVKKMKSQVRGEREENENNVVVDVFSLSVLLPIFLLSRRRSIGVVVKTTTILCAEYISSVEYTEKEE
jgi:uncharacterized protein (UPF0179 family)